MAPTRLCFKTQAFPPGQGLIGVKLTSSVNDVMINHLRSFVSASIACSGDRPGRGLRRRHRGGDLTDSGMLAFEPSTVNVAGDTIKFVNNKMAPHNAVFDNHDELSHSDLAFFGESWKDLLHGWHL